MDLLFIIVFGCVECSNQTERKASRLTPCPTEKLAPIGCESWVKVEHGQLRKKFYPVNDEKALISKANLSSETFPLLNIGTEFAYVNLFGTNETSLRRLGEPDLSKKTMQKIKLENEKFSNTSNISFQHTVILANFGSKLKLPITSNETKIENSQVFIEPIDESNTNQKMKVSVRNNGRDTAKQPIGYLNRPTDPSLINIITEFHRIHPPIDNINDSTSSKLVPGENGSEVENSSYPTAPPMKDSKSVAFIHKSLLNDKQGYENENLESQHEEVNDKEIISDVNSKASSKAETIDLINDQRNVEKPQKGMIYSVHTGNNALERENAENNIQESSLIYSLKPGENRKEVEINNKIMNDQKQYDEKYTDYSRGKRDERKTRIKPLTQFIPQGINKQERGDKEVSNSEIRNRNAVKHRNTNQVNSKEHLSDSDELLKKIQSDKASELNKRQNKMMEKQMNMSPLMHDFNRWVSHISSMFNFFPLHHDYAKSGQNFQLFFPSQLKNINSMKPVFPNDKSKVNERVKQKDTHSSSNGSDRDAIVNKHNFNNDGTENEKTADHLEQHNFRSGSHETEDKSRNFFSKPNVKMNLEEIHRPEKFVLHRNVPYTT